MWCVVYQNNLVKNGKPNELVILGLGVEELLDVQLSDSRLVGVAGRGVASHIAPCASLSEPSSAVKVATPANIPHAGTYHGRP